MPLMTNKRHNTNRDWVTSFVSVAYTSGETYSFPDTNNRLEIRNCNNSTLTLTVAGSTYTIPPFKTQLVTVDYTSFNISSDVNSSAFECTSIIDNGDDAGAEVDSIREQLNEMTNIKGTTQNIIFNSDGSVQRVQHKDSNSNIIREDIFTYNNNLITEVRTLSSGNVLTFRYHLDTLQTEVI